MISALTLVTLIAVGQSGSEPYVRSRVDTGIANDPQAHCLWWGANTITFQQDSAGNPDPPDDSEFTAFSKSLATWQAASDQCGHLTLSEGPRVSDRRIGWVRNAPDNRNMIIYRMKFCQATQQGIESANVPQNDPCWKEQSCQNKYDCFDQAQGTIAITTTTYDTKSGEIFDADIEGNGAFFLFTTVDSPPCPSTGPFSEDCIATDVQNTMTHELGHSLGLDHTNHPGSTMNPSAPSGEISKRVLDPGTQQFMCDAYPKNAAATDCVVQVASSKLGKVDGGCSAAGGPTALMSLIGWALARRRRGAR